MRVARVVGLLGSLALSSALPARAEDPAAEADALGRIWQNGLERSRAYGFLEELSDTIGPRLTGSAGERKAADWGAAANERDRS